MQHHLLTYNAFTIIVKHK